MSPRTKSTPIVDEDTMAALKDYFYKSFIASLNEKSIDTGRLKKLADGCATDSPGQNLQAGQDGPCLPALNPGQT